MARIIVSMRDKALYGKTWPAQAEEVKTMLGLKPGQPLPREGMAERLIQGIRVYVAPLLPGWGKRHNGGWQGLRVMAICECGRHITVSRLQQHKCKCGCGGPYNHIGDCDNWLSEIPERREYHEDTPSLDTSFHDHEMDID